MDGDWAVSSSWDIDEPPRHDVGRASHESPSEPTAKLATHRPILLAVPAERPMPGSPGNNSDADCGYNIRYIRDNKCTHLAP